MQIEKTMSNNRPSVVCAAGLEPFERHQNVFRRTRSWLKTTATGPGEVDRTPAIKLIDDRPC